MVMGEGGEGGQPTQVVAVDNGDGTQQLVSYFFSSEKLICFFFCKTDLVFNQCLAVGELFFFCKTDSFFKRWLSHQAIPVMDPETGQETYMIIDPQVHQSIKN